MSISSDTYRDYKLDLSVPKVTDWQIRCMKGLIPYAQWRHKYFAMLYLKRKEDYAGTDNL